MEKTKIRLQEVNQVKEFVREASRCNFDIDISYNRVVVDAKSLLGVLSLDLTKELSVTCRGYNPNFENILKKFAVS
ncbi:HPr family phosphocarrier protein [Anaeromicropila populeti]|uniref:PTS HPr component phosphorylation site n=1 Tax=Anaeromicropila populeti TaxID=37658 RepID=A0A1I6IQV3_9FIRM|nr:HPr family phosphocarrier protein [Anaeromicropila populeti]SFR69135.1 PTS HPr component phosphorylation site [Anaeromicropila populeti]